MPPPEAVAAGKAQPLSDEDRRTILRWIDLGCPIDLDYDAKQPERLGYGWQLDENRPIVAITLPAAGANAKVDRLLLGLHDYYAGLDAASLSITADVAIDGVAAGENLAGKFQQPSPGVWEWKLAAPLATERARLTVSVKDRAGNTSRVERTFSAK